MVKKTILAIQFYAHYLNGDNINVSKKSNANYYRSVRIFISYNFLYTFIKGHKLVFSWNTLIDVVVDPVSHLICSVDAKTEYRTQYQSTGKCKLLIWVLLRGCIAVLECHYFILCF